MSAMATMIDSPVKGDDMVRAILSLVCVTALLVGGCHSGSVQDGPNARAIAADFEVLTGHAWTGTLNYRDDVSGSIKSAPSSLRVSNAGEGAWSITIHADDPAWVVEECELRLKDSGAVIQRGERHEPVVLRRVRDGSTEVITEFTGVDNGVPATIRNKYILAANECSFRTLVLHQGAEDFFKRCDYHWTW
jgi:hypothetical protein